GAKTASDIVDSVRETFGLQELVQELMEYNINSSVCVKLFKKWKEETLPKIKENPFLLCSVDGVSFHKADDVASRMGKSPTSSYRLSASLTYMVNHLCSVDGHTFIEQEYLLQETLKMLESQNFLYKEFNGEFIDIRYLTHVLFDLEERTVMFEGNLVYPRSYFKYETEVAQKLSILTSSRGGGAMPKIKKVLKKYQKENQLFLTEKQREAVYALHEENVLILTGKPGTGKTTTLKAMIDVYKEIYPKSEVLLSAPTGRASRKMKEATGYEAMTVHRLLGYRQGEIPEYNSDNKLEADLIILDEWSMADLRLMYWLISAIEKGTKVVFIGDVDQLPSVSSGNVLDDMIKSGLPAIHLTEVFRQAENSQIIKNAHKINNGESIVVDHSKEDFYYIEQYNDRVNAELIVRSTMRFLDLGYSLEDILVLSPMRNGDVGIELLNEMLRNAINPKSRFNKEIQLGNRFFREGDKVMQNKNNIEKDVYNGERVSIKSIRLNVKDSNGKKNKDEIICEFDGEFVKYSRSDMVELERGYALTIHKSQGGEAPIVIMPITMSHKVMLTRNLYYTGVTRAKDKVVLIGNMNALNYAIQNDRISQRNSLLDKRIVEYTEHLNKMNVQ